MPQAAGPAFKSAAGKDRRLQLRLEPGRRDRLALNLTVIRGGEALPSISPLIPPPLRALVRTEIRSAAEEADLDRSLSQLGETLRLTLETASGAIDLDWDPELSLTARTRLDLDTRGADIGVSRLLGDARHPDGMIEGFVRVGQTFAADLPSGRLGRIIDTSGWQVADLLSGPEESPTAKDARSSLGGARELAYETEEGDAYDEEAVYTPARRGPSKTVTAEPVGVYPIEKERRVPIAYFNEKQLAFPSGMREAYLKDLLFRVDHARVEIRPRRPVQRLIVWRKADGRLWARSESALDGRVCDGHEALAAAEFLAHLQFRSAALSRKRVKERCKVFLARWLEIDPDRASSCSRPDANSIVRNAEDAMELEETARRFRRSFAGDPIEKLRASREGFFCVIAEPHRRVRLAVQAQEVLEGDLCDWIGGAPVAVAAQDLYARLRRLYERLTPDGHELWFGDEPVRSQKCSFDIEPRSKAGGEWFDGRLRVRTSERTVPEEEWRRILLQSGAYEKDGRLILVDESSLETLRAVSRLMPPLSKRRLPDEPVRIDRLEILDWVRLRSRGFQLQLPAEDEALVSRLLRFERVEPKDQPSAFRGILRDYQKTGYDWLAFLYEHRLGACLADDMGLGKTVQAIAFLGGLKEGRVKPHAGASAHPHLVVAPPTLIFNWKKELEHFCPSLTVTEYSGGKLPTGGADILLTGYETLRRHLPSLARGRYHVLLFDEAQYLKNIRSARTFAARSLKAAFRLTLTGTPLENNLGEFFSVMDLSLPGLLGEYESFRRADDTERLERLRHRARPFILRRTKDAAARELPPKTENEIYLPMTKRQRALYERTLVSVRRQVRSAFESRSAGPAALEALAALTRLRQICVSPRLFDREHAEISPKTQFLVMKLRELLEEDSSALVFSQFTSFLDEVEEALRAQRIEYLRMDGATPASRRKALVESYQSGAAAPVFLISLRTGGVGLNLTRANHVFHLDPWWNPAVEDQASDRAHRIGQKNRVFVTRLLMRGSVEERIKELKAKKAELAGRVLQGIPGGSLGREDLEFLLG